MGEFMNQDQIKEMLLSVENTNMDFTVTLSGKSSKKVNGLYKPDTREIILHNKNFANDNQMAYTAFHEYAHHLECERQGGQISPRCHTASFWACFHSLLEKAEKKGLYKIGADESPELKALTEKIRNEYLAQDGKLMMEFGKLLVEAQKLCSDAGIRFEDYIDRVLSLPKATAQSAIKISQLNINPKIGFENMKTVARQSDPEKRKEAENQFLEGGKSPATIKLALQKQQKEENPVDRLVKEKNRLQHTIEMLQHRLQKVEESIEKVGTSENE